MKFKITLLPLALLITTSVQANTSPVAVNIGSHYNQFANYYVPTIQVTALEDQVIINSVSANGGSCEVYTDNDLVGSSIKAFENGMNPSMIQNQSAKRLQWEQSITYKTKHTKSCKPIREVTVNTDKGSWSFKAN